MSADLQQFILSIPKITRFITISSLSISVLNALKLVSSTQLICHWPYVTERFQVYRMFTGFLIPSVFEPMQMLLDIYMFYNFSVSLEEQKFKNLPDYLYYFVIVGVLNLAQSFCINNSMLHLILLSSVTYTWSRSNKNSIINFYFLPIKASILPLVSLGFHLLLNGSDSFIGGLIGIVSAYYYQCIETGTMGPLMRLFKRNERPVNRVGTLHHTVAENDNYDKGYLQAPNWFYSLLQYPLPARASTSNRADSTPSTPISTGFNPFGGNPVFKGKGRRLGD